MPDFPAQPRLLSIPEVADYLGVNIRHIRRLVHERRIPFIKWGHLIRFKPTDIDTWIDNNRRCEVSAAMPPPPHVRPPARSGHAAAGSASPRQLRLDS